MNHASPPRYLSAHVPCQNAIDMGHTSLLDIPRSQPPTPWAHEPQVTPL